MPVAGVAKLYFCGSARISSTSSLTVLAGTEGLTVSSTGEVTAMVTGSKLLIGSYGTSWKSDGLITWLPPLTNTV